MNSNTQNFEYVFNHPQFCVSRIMCLTLHFQSNCESRIIHFCFLKIFMWGGLQIHVEIRRMKWWRGEGKHNEMIALSGDQGMRGVSWCGWKKVGTSGRQIPPAVGTGRWKERGLLVADRYVLIHIDHVARLFWYVEQLKQNSYYVMTPYIY